MSYSRSCGVSLAACGANKCRCVPVDPEPLFGPESGSCVIHADPDLLAKVDNAPEKPSEARATTLRHDQERHMTAENPADVIEQAAKVIQLSDRWSTRGIARALHDAGLLADPADRDERRNEAYRAQLARADRAEAEVADLRQKWLTFTSALGFGNNRTEPAAELSEMIDPIERAFSDARDHQECAVICELCGDPLAAKTCDECHGSGCLPNSRLAYLECGTCAGVGKVHEGCVEKSYAELVAEVAELEHRLACLLCELTGGRMSKTNYDVRTMVQEVEAYFERTVDDEVAELRATVDRVRALADEWERALSDTLRVEIDELRAALDPDGGES